MDILTAITISTSITSLFGLVSALLSIYAFIPYIVDTMKNRTHPQRASWLIWSVLGSIAFVAQLYDGAGASLWFAAVQVSGTIVVFLLSIHCGSGIYLKSTDYFILCAAAAGLTLWNYTDNAAYALAITISISLMGGSVTIIKAFKNPESETLSTWIIFLVAAGCAVLSVGTLDLTLLAYPLYLFVLYSAIIVAIFLGRLIQREIVLRQKSVVVDIQL